MILSDREIKLALCRDQIRITPAPFDQAISSTSIDLTLHEEISFWTPGQEAAKPAVVAYPGRPEFDVARFLKPGAFVLACTRGTKVPPWERTSSAASGRVIDASRPVKATRLSVQLHSLICSLDRQAQNWGGHGWS